MAQRSKQQSFAGSAFRKQRYFGGSFLKKNTHPQRARAVSTSNPMHIVLKSQKACGELSMRRRKNALRVDAIVRADAKKFGLRLLEFANVGNHLHLLVRVSNRRLFLSFLRSVSGRIAMFLSGGRKGQPVGPFWDWRPFSRITEGDRGYRIARDYVILNEMEAQGIVPPRKKAKYGPSD